jgi:integrase
LQLYLTGNKDADKQTLELAKKIHAKRVLEMQSANHGEFDHSKSHADFIVYFSALGERKSNKKLYKNTLNYLKKFRASITFRSINTALLQEFQKFLLKDLSQNSASTYFNTIRAALHQAVKEDIIPINPADKVENIPYRNPHREFLTIDEIRIIGAGESKYPEIKRAFLFSCFTGLRLSDIQQLSWEHFHGGTIRFRQQKTQELNTMPLSEQALLLAGEVQKTGKIFALELSTSALQAFVPKWIAKLGITKHVTFHTARHTFATLALTSDVDIYTVSKLLGHTDVRHTQIYAKLVDEKKQEAVKKLPSL